jgi:hypothetical protein
MFFPACFSPGTGGSSLSELKAHPHISGEKSLELYLF